MRPVLPFCAAVLVFGIATTASDAGTRAWDDACATAASQPLVVTNFSDSVDHPAKGTLRNILLDVAKPGDTVTFCDTTPVDLAGALSIPSTDKGVTISGGAISAPELRPTAFVIRAPGLQIAGTSFYEVRILVEAGGVTFTHDTFRQRHAGEPYLILADGANGMKIGGAGLDMNTFDSQAKTAIAVQRSDRVSIVGNVITTGGGGRFAVESFANHAFNLQGNATDGDIISLAQSGTISNNVVNGPPGAGVVADSVASGKNLTPRQAIAAAGKSGLGIYVLTEGALSVGNMVIDKNHVTNAALDVERPNVTIGHNILTGGSGMGVTCGHPDEPSRAPVAIDHNTLTGTAKGLRYRCIAAVKATLDGNTVTGGKQFGVFVDAREALIQANTVQQNGERGIWASCPNVKTPGSLELTGNTVTGNGSGITFACGAAMVTAELKNNTVTDNRGAGVLVERTGGTTSITGGTVQRNTGVGIEVSAGAHARISQVAMGANAGAGIESAAVPPHLLKFSGRKVRGVTCRGCLVEVFKVEPGERKGNLHNGEGAAYERAVQAGATGHFVYPATCLQDGTVGLTFTTTEGKGATARTSGFSADVMCTPQVYNVYVHVTFNVTCTVDSTSQKITDPPDATPKEYYFYLTVPPSCPRVGTQSFSVANADALRKNEQAEAAAKTPQPETESSQEDFGESPLPIPAFEPNTTIYATHLQTCSPYDPNPTHPWQYAPPCQTGTRVVVEVVNHEPNG